MQFGLLSIIARQVGNYTQIEIKTVTFMLEDLVKAWRQFKEFILMRSCKVHWFWSAANKSQKIYRREKICAHKITIINCMSLQ